jgi:hypothetical protein
MCVNFEWENEPKSLNFNDFPVIKLDYDNNNKTKGEDII